MIRFQRSIHQRNNDITIYQNLSLLDPNQSILYNVSRPQDIGIMERENSIRNVGASLADARQMHLSRVHEYFFLLSFLFPFSNNRFNVYSSDKYCILPSIRRYEIQSVDGVLASRERQEGRVS